MKSIISVLAILISIAGASHAQTVNAGQFGITEGEDATPAMLKAIMHCRETGSEKLVIPRGRYEFYPDRAFEKYCAISNNDNGLKRIAFPLIGLNNLEIDGSGSEFIFHGHMVPFVIDHSSGIRLHNFSINWDKPFHLQGKVIGVDADKHSFDLLISEENSYDVIGGELMFYSNGVLQNMQHNIWFDPETLATVYKVDEYKIETWNPRQREFYTAEDLGNRIVRISQDVAKLPEVGWIFVVKGKQPKERVRLSPAIRIFQSLNTVLNDINIYHAGGMGVIAERSEAVSLDNVNVLLPPGSGRVISTTADATHFVNCRGQISLLNCTFENMLDDATNVHGVYATIFDLVDRHTIGAKIVHFQQHGFDFAEKGDSLMLLNAKTLIGYQVAKVDSVHVYNEEYVKLFLDREISMNAIRGDGIENLSWSADAHISGCTVRRNRARSILFSTRGEIVVEENTFSSMMAGISIGGGLGYWCESGSVEDVTIRNNRFIDCCTGNPGQSVILIKPGIEIPEGSKEYYHRNITISENLIQTFDRSIVSARSVDGLSIRGNTIIQTHTFPPRYPDRPTFEFTHCRNVKVTNNQLAAEKRGEIACDGDTSGWIEIKRNKGF